MSGEKMFKIILICAMVFLVGTFGMNVFSVFGPSMQMRKDIKQINKSLDTAANSIVISKTKLDSLSKLLQECNEYINNVKKQVNIIDARQQLENNNFKILDAGLRKRLKTVIDSLDRENADSVISKIRTY
jgi:septal ring factor EnvC (AmiA/AmiB activator)